MDMLSSQRCSLPLWRSWILGLGACGLGLEGWCCYIKAAARVHLILLSHRG